MIDLVSPKEKEILKNKEKFNYECKKNNISSPKTIGLFEDGVANILEKRLPKMDLFSKEKNGRQSSGIYKWSYENNKWYSKRGVKFGHERLVRYLSEESKVRGELILQPCYHNHESWQPFTSGALATVRILMGRSKEGAVPIAAALRMPTGSEVGDNFHLGGIASPVNLKTGRLGPAVRKQEIDPLYFDRHPDTEAQLTGTELPSWGKVVECARNVHDVFDAPIIGWDIALTSQGPFVIEGNAIPGAALVQIPHGRPLTQTNYATIYDRGMKDYAHER